MAQYQEGTVTVTNGSASVIGSGTAWQMEGVQAGDVFVISGEGTWYSVASVAGETTLTLTAPYGGATGSGKAYAISPLTKAAFSGSRLH